MNDEYVEKLKNQIWITRASRINAEKRLKSKETFIQAMSIYYSCFTVLLSICLFVWQGMALNILSLTMTIALLICILHFKSLSYIERAVDFRKKYTDLQKLEFLLNHDPDENEVKSIEEQYCNFLADGENHITFDYQKAIANSKEPFKNTVWTNKMKRQYLASCFGRFLLKTLCIILPLIIIIMILWGTSDGWFISA